MSGTIRPLILLASAQARDGFRWMIHHLYLLLLLGPIVFGFTWFTIRQAMDSISDLGTPPDAMRLIFAFAAVAGFCAAGLTSAGKQLFHLRQPAQVSESLPVTADSHFYLALVTRLLRLAPAVFALALIFDGSTVFSITRLMALAVVCLSIVEIELFSAQVWIHQKHRRNPLLVIGTSAISLLTAGVAAVSLVSAIGETPFDPGFFRTKAISNWFIAVPFLLCILIHFTSVAVHRRWRSKDIDFAQRLGARGSTRREFWNRIARRLPTGVAAGVRRDVLLTARMFSTAVFFALGISLLVGLLQALVMYRSLLPRSLLPRGPAQAYEDLFSATWLPAVLFIKIACVVSIAATMSLLPVLINYQSAYLWLERVSGVSGKTLLETKVWYARLIAFPVVVFIVVTGTVVGIAQHAIPWSYVLPLFAECAWIWWMSTTLAGLLAFEIADRPELSVPLILIVDIAAGGFAAAVWILGLALYGMSRRSLAERGAARAHYLLTSEGE